ncbi:MAG: multiheme c-type cytochrome [Candidatus Eisenbacteria bacterium]
MTSRLSALVLPAAIAAAIVIAALALSFASSDAQTRAANPSPNPNPDPSPRYIGAEGCKSCHAGKARGSVFETWTSSPHGRAFLSLPPASQKDERCLACHTTGFGRPVVAGKTAEILRNVQCEACHGPGSEYKFVHGKDRKAALGLGMLEPTEAVCAACHTPEPLPRECWREAGASPSFDYSAMVKKIAHARPSPKKR